MGSVLARARACAGTCASTSMSAIGAMKCCKRAAVVTLDPEVAEVPALKELTKRWQVTPAELQFFWERFQFLDKNGNGVIEFDEFFSFWDEERSRFLQVMYEFIARGQHDEDMNLPFTNWMIAVFQFAFATKEELLQGIFQAYDRAQVGYLSEADLENFIYNVHNENPIFPADVVCHLRDSMILKGRRMEYDEFLKNVLRFPMLVWPIVRVQNVIQDQLIGRKLFVYLDKRSPDMEFKDTHKVELKAKWAKRREMCTLFWCGFPCCRTSRSLKDDPTEEAARQRREIQRRRRWHERKANAPDIKALEVIRQQEEKENAAEAKRQWDKKEAADRELGAYESEGSSDEFTELEVDEYEDLIV